ncbi:unnamed protein product [Jaminaea pallidilutea]
MPRLALQIKAQLENVKELRPSTDDYTLMVKTQCTSCHEEHPKLVAITPESEIETKGGRGTADLVMSCQFCKREGSAKFEENPPKEPRWRPYSNPEDSGADWRTLCVLDVRGMDLVGWEPMGTWKCKATSGNTTFDDVEFDESSEWTDYDEGAGEPVGITELEGKWVRS